MMTDQSDRSISLWSEQSMITANVLAPIRAPATQSGRQLCQVLDNQVQTFDNFIPPTVDSVKNLTPLEYDILSCSLTCISYRLL